ncbi:hypothetical protein [Sphingomonas sp.]|jgi:hypothetical protein|uniref:hypothetical protein n=1 Tax=Sphingomonas sp. TaxID=28214 RepID=UPI002E30CDCE|nr:hypothetical protein [Sphingomonas sp.]HEX4694734.1 hypothetical protein [Sphingomonas sp.]
MSSRPERQLSTVERAYELARSGRCETMEDIRRALIAERHDSIQAHLAGPSIRRQLLALCKAAKVLDTDAPSGQD